MMLQIKSIIKLDKTDKYNPLPIVNDTTEQTQTALYAYKVAF